MTTSDLGAHYLDDARKLFRLYRDQAERAMAQIGDEAFFRVVEADGNSIAIIVKHIAGSVRSRWTEFLTTDGEKPDRHRDGEFEVYDADSREHLMAFWNASWELLFGVLDNLTADDLMRTVTIRGEPHTAIAAINRQLMHNALHVGQIITLARQDRGANWQPLSIPRGGSAQYNAAMEKKAKQ